MAAPDVSAVVALTNKAFDLWQAGHAARSKEYKLRALAAAQALGAEDCLIVAALQLDQANILHTAGRFQHHAQRAPGVSPFAAMLVPFFAAAASAQRRKAAGTLLAGCCRDAEVTWNRRKNEHLAEVCQDGIMEAGAAEMASLMGYDTFMSAADFACDVVAMANMGIVSVTQERLRACIVLIADAAELLVQPRIREQDGLSGETKCMDSLHKLVTHPAWIAPHGADGARLLANWKRVEQSGVLQRRGAEEFIKIVENNRDAGVIAAAAAAAAPGLRTCALASCGAREAHPQHFKSCAACRIPVYCCKEHQTADWPSHKAACKAARKAAAEEQAS